MSGSTGQNWKDVLGEIYRFAPHKYGESSKMTFSNNQHELARKLRISGYELMLAVAFLTDQKLLFLNVPPGKEYSSHLDITEKGFNVALENERAQSSNRFQETLVVVGALTVFFSAFSFLSQGPKAADLLTIIIWVLAFIMVSAICAGLTWIALLRSFEILISEVRKLKREK
jgi:hypothetical protein